MVNTLISILNMVVVLGTIQAVSKLVSEVPGRARAVRALALKVQLALGGGLSAGLALFAEPVCAFVFRDPGLAPYVRIGAGVTFFYAAYAVFVGLLNGLARFTHQASLDMLFSTLKLGLIISLVVAGYGVLGAFAGFVAAAAVMVVAAGLVSERGLPARAGGPVPVSRLLGLLLPILATTLAVNLLLQLDVLILKGLVYRPVADHLLSPGGMARLDRLLGPLGASADPALAAAFTAEGTSHIAGLFGGAKNVSLLPYQATVSLTMVVFPLVSRSTHDADRPRAARQVRQAFRFTVIVAGLLWIPLTATAEPLLGLLLGPRYASAAGALAVLLAATVLLAVLVVGITVLNSMGRVRLALAIAASTLALHAALLFALVRTSPDLGPSVTLRAAIATALAVTVGLAATLLAVWRAVGAAPPWATIVRIAVLGAIILPATRLVAVHSLPGLALEAIVVGLAALAGLLALGEATREDRATLSRILRRRPSR